MRHTRPEDLDVLEPLLARLRALDGLAEKSPGSFYRGSKAFLHFHAHGDERYADVKVGDTFERFPATTATDHRALLALVRRTLPR